MKKKILCAAVVMAGVLPVLAYAYPPFAHPGVTPVPHWSGTQSTFEWVEMQLGGALRLGDLTARSQLWDHIFLPQHCPNGYVIVARDGVSVRERMWHSRPTPPQTQGDANLVFTFRNLPQGNYDSTMAVLHREPIQDEVQITRMGTQVINGTRYWGALVNRRSARIFTTAAYRSTVANEGPWVVALGSTIPLTAVEADFVRVCRRVQGGQCGDGMLDTDLGETCDDGNLMMGDGCNEQCLLEGGSSSSSSSGPYEEIGTAIVTECGDGVVEPGDECDDGNTMNGDGCSDICLIESTSPPVFPVCGDGTAQTWNGEQCDDGNLLGGDGCDATCQIETGTPPPPMGYCGDLIVQPPETCDDGNLLDGDGCSAMCQTE